MVLRFCTKTKRLSTYLIARWWNWGWFRTSRYILLHHLSKSVTAKFESVGEICDFLAAPLTPYNASNCQARWEKWVRKLAYTKEEHRCRTLIHVWNRGNEKILKMYSQVPHLSVTDPRRFQCVGSATRRLVSQRIRTHCIQQPCLRNTLNETNKIIIYVQVKSAPSKHDGQFAKSVVYSVHQAIVATFAKNKTPSYWYCCQKIWDENAG